MKIKCVNPEHEDSSPSMEIYEEYGHCFACGYRVPLADLGLPSYALPSRPAPTDLKGELERIKALPLGSIRGLSLPVDGDSFYIVWPSGDYYKRRKYFPGDGPKYLCPRGHAKPLFVARTFKGSTLAIVEGELNALSLASLNPPFSVVSPGGVTDFNEKIIDKSNKLFLGYSKFHVILDLDSPGLSAAIKFKQLLLKHSPYVTVHLMERDCNELLMAGELRNEIKNWG